MLSRQFIVYVCLEPNHVYTSQSSMTTTSVRKNCKKNISFLGFLCLMLDGTWQTDRRPSSFYQCFYISRYFSLRSTIYFLLITIDFLNDYLVPLRMQTFRVWSSERILLTENIIQTYFSSRAKNYIDNKIKGCIIRRTPFIIPSK